MRILSTLAGCILSLSVQAATPELAERLFRLAPSPTRLFPAPVTELDRNLFDVGRSYHWLRYGREIAPSEGAYKGYALYSDPYHLGLKRISFLVGSDCSHFVHRLFQLMGADYPYAKTRHFIALAKRPDERPADLLSCRWDLLKSSFERIDATQMKAGDVLVFSKAIGPYGEHGHMGLLVSEAPREMLHAMGPRDGYVRGPIEAELLENMYVFRWRGPLRNLEASTLAGLMDGSYPQDPAPCDEPR